MTADSHAVTPVELLLHRRAADQRGILAYHGLHHADLVARRLLRRLLVLAHEDELAGGDCPFKHARFPMQDEEIIRPDLGVLRRVGPVEAAADQHRDIEVIF